MYRITEDPEGTMVRGKKEGGGKLGLKKKRMSKFTKEGGWGN